MAKLTVLSNPMQTLLKWGTQMKALTFKENMQTDVRLGELKEGDILSYNLEDKIFKNGVRFKDWIPESKGTLVYTVTTKSVARYTQIGNLTIGYVYLEGTTSGVAGNIIYITAPTIPATNGLAVQFARVRDNTVGNSADGVMLPYTTFGGTLGFYKTDLTNWGLNTGRILVSTFIYENV